ncbi:MAG: hypothetical protein SFU86_17290 [Pirellulaceae bacterium]|nr:hypothetical protein [Pirellulaceae bacterium]
MLTRRHLLLAVVSLSTSLLAVAAQANPRQAFDQIEGIAIRTRNHSRELANQLRDSRLPLGRAYRDLATMQQVADNLRVVADNYGNPEQIAADVRSLSVLVGRVSQDLSTLPVGGLGTRHVNVRNLNRLALELQQDVADLQIRLSALASPVVSRYPGGGYGPSGYGNFGGYGPADFGGQHFGGHDRHHDDCQPTLAPQVQPRPGVAYGPSGLGISGRWFSLYFGR